MSKVGDVKEVVEAIGIIQKVLAKNRMTVTNISILPGDLERLNSLMSEHCNVAAFRPTYSGYSEIMGVKFRESN